MLIADLFMMAKTGNNPGKLNKLYYIHTMQYHSVIKRKELL